MVNKPNAITDHTSTKPTPYGVYFYSTYMWVFYTSHKYVEKNVRNSRLQFIDQTF